MCIKIHIGKHQIKLAVLKENIIINQLVNLTL